MSDIQTVFDRINDIEATLAQASEADGVLTFADKLANESLKQRRDELVALTKELTARQLIDVCDYRIIPEHGNQHRAKAVAATLDTFQDMVTAFFASIREGRPRHKANFTADIVNASSLNVGYAYAGSLGFVLYVPSDQLQVGGTDLDKALASAFSLAEQRTPEGVRAVADEFGRAAVRTFYSWAQSQVEYGLAAEIKWERGDEIKSNLLIQTSELEAVISVIDKSSEEKNDTVELPGMLVAIDVTRQSFKMSFPDADDITGRLDSNFNWQTPHSVPSRYVSTLNKRTIQRLWSEDDVVSWTLLELREG